MPSAASTAPFPLSARRYGYDKHIVKQVVECTKGREECLKVCNAGLAYMYSKFECASPRPAPPRRAGTQHRPGAALALGIRGIRGGGWRPAAQSQARAPRRGRSTCG